MKNIFIIILFISILFSGCTQLIEKVDEKNLSLINLKNISYNKTITKDNDKNDEIINFYEDRKKENENKTIIEKGNTSIKLEKRQENTKSDTININSFAYQLQNNNYDEIKNANYDLIVIDIDEASFSKDQIKEISKDKFLISYLSIGEAESYRSYWKDNWKVKNPSFIDEENPNWAENYKVKYWDKEWQDIMIKQLDKIIDAGYDGAYFDIIDAYEYYENKGRESSKEEMINFVIKLSNHAKEKNPNFLIIPQNALDLLKDESYLKAIDGVGKEDSWYVDNYKISKEDTTYVVNLMKIAKENDKFILVIDYPTKKNLQEDFIEKAKNEGFIPYVSNRELDTLY